MSLVRHLVDHPEGEDKVRPARDSEPKRCREMGSPACPRITTTYPPGEDFKHPLLDVNSDNPAASAHEATHGNGEKTHARADVYGRVAWP